MDAISGQSEAKSPLEGWVDEGDFFSRKRVSNLTERGDVFVERITESGHVLTEQAKAILLRSNVAITTHSFKFYILKGSFFPSNKRNMKNVIYGDALVFRFRLPKQSATRLFLECICAHDMEEMGFDNIVLPHKIWVRGGMSCRLVVRKHGDSVIIGTFIEEESDRWNKDTGFLFVAW